MHGARRPLRNFQKRIQSSCCVLARQRVAECPIARGNEGVLGILNVALSHILQRFHGVHDAREDLIRLLLEIAHTATRRITTEITVVMTNADAVAQRKRVVIHALKHRQEHGARITGVTGDQFD